MLAQILSAVGLGSTDPLESDSHQERVEAHAALVARIGAAAEARRAAAAQAFQDAANADIKSIAEARAKLEATRAKLGKEIARTLRESVEALTSLGDHIWDRAVYASFVAGLAAKYPSLVTTLSVDLHGQQVALGSRLRAVCTPHANGFDTVAVYDALLDLEKRVSEIVAHASDATPYPSARAEFDLALEHSSRADHQAALEKHRAERDALAMAALPRNAGGQTPRNVSGTAA